MEKLTIEHLALYFNHNIQFTDISGDGPIYDLVELGKGTITLYLETAGIETIFLDELIDRGYRLLLRPLSQLTEEIEHNREKEIVLNWFIEELQGEPSDFIENGKGIWQVNNEPIGGLTTYETSFMIFEPIEDEQHAAIYLETKSDDGRIHNIEALRYDQMVYLIERHFDVFNLIKSGLALEK